MNNKIIIKSKKDSNLLESLKSYMKKESIEYVVTDTIAKIENDITTLIYLDESDVDKIPLNKKVSIILISNERKIIKDVKSTINYIITDLIDDNSKYTSVQKEYLFSRGIYQTFLQIIGELLNNVNNYNGIIYDLIELKKKPDDWIFKFDSINETYKWLEFKNRNLEENFTQKVISFYSDKVYNDSLNEINYLSEKLLNIKKKQHIIDLFVLTKEEFKTYKTNYFYKTLLNNISDTYNVYFVDKDAFIKKDLDIYEKLIDGVIIYKDCVYQDTYSDEISLGFVDCKEETIKKYNEYFDYVLNKYGQKISVGGDIDGI